MPRISQDEVLGYLRKNRVIRDGPAVYQEGVPQSQVPGAVPVQSVMLNPTTRLQGYRGRTQIQPRKVIDYRVLRRLSEEAWLVNTLIIHLQNQVRPFLKPSTDKNIRGFQIRLRDADATPSDAAKEYLKTITDFFIKTGFGPDPERRDNLIHFGMKGVRDYLSIDQLATELQLTVTGKPFAFWATDPATIIRVTEEGWDGDDAIRYIQEIDKVETARYTDRDMIFDFGNPRSDIEYAGYGYSRVEAAIRLVLSEINTFAYQSGALTEDSLPRGAILLSGDADMGDVEQIQDYIIDIMSNSPASKWKIPIIPGGAGSDGKGNALQWVSFRNTNRDMEFIEWHESLQAAVCALFGTDMEEIGLRSSKASSIIAPNTTPRLEESKSRGLSTCLTFLEGHFQQILDRIDDRLDFEFIGYEKDDPKAKADLDKAQLETWRTIDEIRVERDQKPFNEDWSKMPLHPSAVQIFMSAKQQENMAAMGGGMGGMQGQPQGDQGPGGDQDYRNLMMDPNDGNDEEPTGGQGSQGEIPEQGETKKSLIDDIIEIVV